MNYLLTVISCGIGLVKAELVSQWLAVEASVKEEIKNSLLATLPAEVRPITGLENLLFQDGAECAN